MFIVSALILWLLILIAAGLWLIADPDPDPPQPPPRDPVAELVDKWAHDWERGRA